jgi:hypothetical protein
LDNITRFRLELGCHPIHLDTMQAVGYVRVSTDRQAEHGVSLEAQEAKILAMATIHSAELLEVITDSGESAKSLNRLLLASTFGPLRRFNLARPKSLIL